VTGRVQERRPLLTITFLLEQMPGISIEFVVDTGFTDFLTLPEESITAMKLSFSHRAYGTLADGNPIEFDVYAATILWDNEELTVPVVATGKRPLLGTSLLEQYALKVEFIEQGKVSVEKIEESWHTINSQ
jgi:clan AA aspartic protease